MSGIAKHRWKLRLEIETDQGVDGTDSMVIELVSKHSMDGNMRPVNEVLANDMATICQMVIESGRVVCPTTLADSCSAFGDILE